ncbi:MAG: hypothetical protein DWP92_09420 [Armatimonadetes bacterium]|nr:MAG: hypothetical protein DWP92_09420 [Armatimonadota bacterium]
MAHSHRDHSRDRDRAQPPPNHTRMCNTVAAGIPVYRESDLMTLDRGILARIDSKIITELDHGDGVRLVKVPLSRAVWATWRRYCDTLGLTMGAAIAGLVVHELGVLVDGGEPSEAVHVVRYHERLLAESEALDVRERHLEERERSLTTAQHLLSARTRPLKPAQRLKVGRNDPCPCGSGYKYKRCHGT